MPPVFQHGRKIHGKYFIISAREGTEDDAAVLKVTMYSPSTSQRLQRTVTLAMAQVTLKAHHADLAKCDTTKIPAHFGGTADSDGATAFYNAVVHAVVSDLSVAIGVEVPEATVVAAQAARSKGNDAYLSKDVDGALSWYTQAVELVPESVLYRLNRSAALVELGKLDDAVAECKTVVALGRRLRRRYANPFEKSAKPASTAAVKAADGAKPPLPPLPPSPPPTEEAPGAGAGANAGAGAPASPAAPAPPAAPASTAAATPAMHPHLSFLTGAQPLNAVVAKAYARIGGAYLRQNRPTKAISAFTLSLKSRRMPEVQERLNQTLAATRKAAVEAAAARAKASGAPLPPMAPLPDVEEVLARHDVSQYHTDFQFECTGCGECCRSADHIFLSPADLFRMTRAPALRLDSVVSTSSLRAKFKDAMKYSTRDLLPVCQLRPALSKLGRCHFAYPLHKNPKTGALLSFEETRSQLLVDYKPVDPSEYNLTEAEELDAVARVEAAEAAGEYDDEEEEDAGAGGAGAGAGTGAGAGAGAGAGSEGSGTDSDSDDEPEAVLNSFNRQALGCRFGRDHMPAMCSTYPIARELSWTDFWHDTESELQLGPAATPSGGSPGRGSDASAGAGAGAGAGAAAGGAAAAAAAAAPEPESTDVSKPTPDSLHLDEQEYVVVKTDGCEGFFPDGKTRTDVFGGSATQARTQTMGQFIRDNGIHDKWKDDDWFKALLNSLVRSKIVAQVSDVDKRAAVELVQALAMVWYDFDGLAAARKRPFQTWRRVKRSIDSLTAMLVAAAEKLVSKPPAEDVAKAAKQLFAGVLSTESLRG